MLYLGYISISFFLDLRVTRLSPSLYPQLGSNLLSGRVVVHVEVHGSCCWTIYNRRTFRGETQHLDLGFSGHPNIQIQSMKTDPCGIAI
jgi:hypothetical protein